MVLQAGNIGNACYQRFSATIDLIGIPSDSNSRYLSFRNFNVVNPVDGYAQVEYIKSGWLRSRGRLYRRFYVYTISGGCRNRMREIFAMSATLRPSYGSDTIHTAGTEKTYCTCNAALWQNSGQGHSLVHRRSRFRSGGDFLSSIREKMIHLRQ